MLRVLFFLFFTTLLFSAVDYIDYSESYDREEYYNVHVDDTNSTSLNDLGKLEEKIAAIELQIHAIESGEWSPAENQDKTIYLTFDDGPLQGTKSVLEVLESEEVSATFFFVGEHIEKERDLFSKVKHSPYTLVANHTYSHASGHYSHFYRNPQRVLLDVERAQKCIGGDGYYQRLAGRNVWRLPSYSCNDYALKRYVQKREEVSYNRVSEAGYTIFGWDLEWAYTRKTGRPLWSSQEMYRRILFCCKEKKSVEKNKIVLLMHDFMFRGAAYRKEMLRSLIGLLKKDGWRFETVDHYICQKIED